LLADRLAADDRAFASVAWARSKVGEHPAADEIEAIAFGLIGCGATMREQQRGGSGTAAALLVAFAVRGVAQEEATTQGASAVSTRVHLAITNEPVGSSRCCSRRQGDPDPEVPERTPLTYQVAAVLSA
jgi:hypothetical protein